MEIFNHNSLVVLAFTISNQKVKKTPNVTADINVEGTLILKLIQNFKTVQAWWR